MNIRSRLGTKEFYSKVLSIAVPMMLQNGLSNFVNLLDNLMIGRVGTNAISGVAIANQLIFVFYLVIFGATAGVGIFTAQFYGKGDTKGVRDSFRFKIVANTILASLCVLLFALFSPALISMFLKGEGSPEDAAQTLKIGTGYMHIMLIGLVPIGLTQAYSGTLKDTGNISRWRLFRPDRGKYRTELLAAGEMFNAETCCEQTEARIQPDSLSYLLREFR